jgi:exonuclease III
MDTYTLSIVWWNTSLSPPISSKRGISTNSKKESIALVIKEFMNSNYEFICLGEVSSDDLDFFDNFIQPQALGYSCAKGVTKESRLYFDTCIYFKKHNHLIRQNNEDVKKFIMNSSNSNYKVGQKYKFKLSIDEHITIYTSHWPSQLRNADLQLSSIAERLRCDIETESESVDNILLVGDYNVEPYDKRIVHHLQSSREKELVLKRNNIFYNPCWKFLSSNTYLDSKHKIGTYHYPNAQFNSWQVIDQIMFSKSFLLDTWTLNDDDIRIINPILLSSPNVSQSDMSDHFPLVAKISKASI